MWTCDIEEVEWGGHILGSSYAVGNSTYADHNVWSYDGRGGGELKIVKDKYIKCIDKT